MKVNYTITYSHILNHLNFQQVGLLPKDNPEQVPFAYKLYKRIDKAGNQLSAGFKQTFAQDVTIDFMGLWYG